MKRIFSLVLVVIMCSLVFCSCGNGSVSSVVDNRISIPDVENLDVDTAKTLLAGKGLIPKVEYEYNDEYECDLVMYTVPEIGSKVDEDTPVTIYVSKGPSFYYLSSSVGYMYNVYNIDNFDWDEGGPDGTGTKGFYTPWVEEGYLHIKMCLVCKSRYSIEFYGDFGTASINDTFDKTVPIDLIYDSKQVDNTGTKYTYFTAKIPLSDLGVQKPTNIYIEFDFKVNGNRETFKANFDLSW